MVAKNDGESSGVYLDASALAKLYLPEPESDRLNEFLRGRRDLRSIPKARSVADAAALHGLDVVRF
jgi:hypothetical protein